MVCQAHEPQASFHRVETPDDRGREIIVAIVLVHEARGHRLQELLLHLLLVEEWVAMELASDDLISKTAGKKNKRCKYYYFFNLCTS